MATLPKAELLRRTFAAKNHPAGSPERAELNKDVLTSEYMPSYKFLVRRPFTMSDGTPHPTQKHIDETFPTKAAAAARVASLVEVGEAQA